MITLKLEEVKLPRLMLDTDRSRAKIQFLVTEFSWCEIFSLKYSKSFIGDSTLLFLKVQSDFFYIQILVINILDTFVPFWKTREREHKEEVKSTSQEKMFFFSIVISVVVLWLYELYEQHYGVWNFTKLTLWRCVCVHTHTTVYLRLTCFWGSSSRNTIVK